MCLEFQICTTSFSRRHFFIFSPFFLLSRSLLLFIYLFSHSLDSDGKCGVFECKSVGCRLSSGSSSSIQSETERLENGIEHTCLRSGVMLGLVSCVSLTFQIRTQIVSGCINGGTYVFFPPSFFSSFFF